ncbi:MAG: hypothetical protein WC637_10490 [Victivallales bacterium]
MFIISKRDQARIRKHQEATGETARCFADLAISEQVWSELVQKYGIIKEPLEIDTDLGFCYWENHDGSVRLLTKGNPGDKIVVVSEITVYANPAVVSEIDNFLQRVKRK